MSATQSIRVTVEVQRELRALADGEHRPMYEIIHDSLREYARMKFLKGVNASYAKLKKNSETWRGFKNEVESMEGTLMDGIE